MKKSLAILLALVLGMSLCFSACGKNTPQTPSTGTTTPGSNNDKDKDVPSVTPDPDKDKDNDKDEPTQTPDDGEDDGGDYASVSYEVAKGEKFDPNSAYDDKALDVFGRLNWTFQQKDEWYASFHSMVSTTVDQDVRTLKQYKDGMLISADISTSSLVNLAREFCYIPSQDRVIWREAKGGPSTYDGFDTPWSEGEPKGNMTISGPDGFKAKNGLPATELSVYIFREETVLSADPVTVNADGTYTITYHMNPEVWETEGGTSEGAAAYYCNQMKFTGGLTDVPKFKKIDVSFTFNENYETLCTAIHEEYSATMGFTVGCSADSTTEYSYTTPFAPLTNAYEEYFKKYVLE